MLNKIKVGILTFHDGFNHGGFLQAYCLQRTLEELGAEVLIINYSSRKYKLKEIKTLLISGIRSSFGLEILKAKILNLMKILTLKSNMKTMLKLTPFSKNLEKITRQEQFDLVILGSDEIWNFQNPLVGLDHSYFGENIYAESIVSYAPSFGSVALDETIPKSVVDCLSRLTRISVRDEHSSKLIKGIGLNAETVLDPTFLYNIQLSEKGNTVTEYILVYLNGNPPESVISELREFASSSNKKLLALGYYKPWCDLNYVNVSIFDWLSFFKNSDLVITNTFHGTIFSILNEKEFCVLDSKRKSNKLNSLLDLLLLTKRKKDSQRFAEVFGTTIDYQLVQQRIQQERKKSFQYLQELVAISATQKENRRSTVSTFQ